MHYNQVINMTFRHIFVSSILAFSALTTPAHAEKGSATNELAAPIINLMPALKEIRDELKLDEKQTKAINAWVAEAPTKRKELKLKIVEVRSELREALLNRDDRIKREKLKFELSEANRRLIELKSLCARMLHKTLTSEQYAKVVAKYKESMKS